jgi:hypothetical protein
VEAGHFVGLKAAKVEYVRRIEIRGCALRQLDLVEVPVFHAPEHVAPCRVQRTDRLVAAGKPLSKALQGRLRVGGHSVVTAQFVVRLPRHHGGVIAVAPHHFADNARAVLAIDRAR